VKLLKYITCFGAILLQLSANAQSPQSLKSFRVNGVFNDTLASVATGFIIKSPTKHYLITNLHVIRHINPVNENGLWKMADDPNKTNLPPAKLISIKYYDSLRSCFRWIQAPLIDPDGNKLYTQIKFMNNEADVVAIPIENLPEKLEPRCVDYKSIDVANTLEPTDPVYMVGFPAGWEDQLPFWKPAYIAIDDRYFTFYVNTEGYNGMSGAPCWVHSKGKYHFVGIYSMDYRPEDYDIGIGIVWKSTLLKAEFEKLE